jgi:UDP:flavonoid glycosyltransferase YjiC (YdhE family)
MKILIAPLDWGLGHATRCVPLIRALRAAGHAVVPCAGGAGLRLLRAEFPDLEVEEAPAYAMRYTRNRALLPLWLALQLPAFFASIRGDGTRAARLVRKHEADLVISDGRYGFRSAAAPAIFISHQLHILPPGPARLRAALARPIRALNRFALRGFREVWVPDFPGARNLSGILGHPPGGWPGARYIHPLCRFRPEDLPWDRAAALPAATGPAIDTLALLSGPEPQRTLLEEKVRAAFAAMPGTRVIVRGVPSRSPRGTDAAGENPLRENALTVFDHLPQERLLACLASARRVVCRSGYTTMMELAGLGKANVLLVPTPGQPEQEYLAIHARASGFAAWQDQEAPDLEAGLREAGTLPGFGSVFDATREGGGEAFDLAAWIRENPLLARA